MRVSVVLLFIVLCVLAASVISADQNIPHVETYKAKICFSNETGVGGLCKETPYYGKA